MPFAFQEDVAKSSGVTINLWLGVFSLMFGVGMTAWTFISPSGLLHHHEDMGDDGLPELL